MRLPLEVGSPVQGEQENMTRYFEAVLDGSTTWI